MRCKTIEFITLCCAVGQLHGCTGDGTVNQANGAGSHAGAGAGGNGAGSGSPAGAAGSRPDVAAASGSSGAALNNGRAGSAAGSGGSSGRAGAGAAASGSNGGAGGPDPLGMDHGPVPMATAGDTVGDFTYYEVEGAICRDGSNAGYYLRKGTSKNLLVFLNGGGVCFDDFFCGINPANVNQSLPGEDLFGATLDAIGGALLPVRQTPPDEGIFKADPSNPVAEWSMVFVPYCTGDVHAGTSRDAPVTTSTSLPNQNFVGYTNLGLFYRSLTSTLGPDVMTSEKVLLAGSSAGGFGALMNYDRTQDFFDHSRVYAISDSGVPFRDQYLEPCLQKKWRELWGLDKILPKDCKGCFNADGGGLAEGLGHFIFKEKYAGRMLGGGISSTQDQIIKLFFSAGLDGCATDTGAEAVASFLGAGSYPPERYPAGLQDFVDNVASAQSIGTYFIDSDLHQHLFRPRYYEQNGVGKTIAEWVGDLLHDQPERLGSTSGTSGSAGAAGGGANAGAGGSGP
jgi:hypothetical protein